MDDPLGRWLIAILYLLFIAALAACETGVKHADEEDKIHPARLRAILRDQRHTGAALLFARLTFLFLLAGSLCPLLGGAWWQNLLCCLGAAAVTAPLCDVLPRRLARRNPEGAVHGLRFLIVPLCTLLRPLSIGLVAAAEGLMRLFGVDPAAKEEVTQEEIQAMMDIGEETGNIEQSEREIISNVFDFVDMTAADCMTHRTDVTALWVDEDKDAIFRTIRETGLSRFPVYNEDIDDVIGILATRDFLLNESLDTPRPVRELLREPYLVPETVKTDVLLRDMQRAKTHMAIVVDEYGGVSGIVTMEDLLEEIVGNIYDEFDPADEAEIVPLGKDVWQVSGTAEISALAEAMNVTLPETEDYDTVGGLIFSRLSAIPPDGSTPELTLWCTRDGEKPQPDDEDEDEPRDVCDRVHIKVEKIEDRRVESARVTLLRDQPVHDAPGDGSRNG